jgi:hypothetical protein
MADRLIGLNTTRFILVGFSALMAAVALLDIYRNQINDAVIHLGLSLVFFGDGLRPEAFLQQLNFKQFIMDSLHDVDWKKSFVFVGYGMLCVGVLSRIAG